MKLSDYKGEEGIDLLADLLGPIVEIYNDKDFRDAVARSKSNLEIVQLLLKQHKKEVLYMMARIDKEDPETYEPSFFGLPMKLLEIIKMPEVAMLFSLQSQRIDNESSGSATENTGEAEG
jgi:hypothetical protein